MRSLAQMEWVQKAAQTEWVHKALNRAGEIPALERFVRRVKPEARWKRVSRRALPYLATGGASAITVYLMDPDRGRARRARLKGEVAGTVRRSRTRVGRSVRRMGSDARGWRRRLEPRTPKSGFNDATLAHKVESEVLRKAGVDKSRLNVNAEDGVIVLRGEVDTPEDMARLEGRIRKLSGVRDVRTLLHLKNQLPHTKEPSIAASRRAMSDLRRSG